MSLSRIVKRVRPLARVALAFAFALPAYADAPAVDVRTWAPSPDPRASLVLEPPSTVGPWAWSADAFVRYEHAPVALSAGSTVVSRPLRDVLGVDLLANLGLGDSAQAGVRVPIVVAERGDAGLPASQVAGGQVPASALGDVSLVAKGAIRPNDRGGLGLGVVGEVGFPTGSKGSFASDAGVTASARLLADLSAQVVSLQASLGYALRTDHVRWPSSLGGVVFGDSIPWTIGLAVRPAIVHAVDPGGRQTWEVALQGAFPAGPVAPFDSAGAALRPAVLAFSNRIGLGHHRDAFILAGMEVGLDRAVGVPSFRATLGFGVRFASHDADRDGIEDDVDLCPTLAEDRDGYEDADGCPEADNDQDGIVDAEDACPNAPGAASPDPRRNGCP